MKNSQGCWDGLPEPSGSGEGAVWVPVSSWVLRSALRLGTGSRVYVPHMPGTCLGSGGGRGEGDGDSSCMPKSEMVSSRLRSLRRVHMPKSDFVPGGGGGSGVRSLRRAHMPKSDFVPAGGGGSGVRSLSRARMPKLDFALAGGCGDGDSSSSMPMLEFVGRGVR